MAGSRRSQDSGRRSRRRQKKSSSPAAIILLVVLLLLLVGAGVGYFFFGDQIKESLGIGKPKEYYDPAAVTGQYHENGYTDSISTGSLFPLVNTEIAVSSATGEAILGFENVAANPYDLQLVLLQGGTEVFSTGVIRPGQYVEKGTITPIPGPGTYSVVARFIAYDQESHKAVGKVDYPETIKLNVQ